MKVTEVYFKRNYAISPLTMEHMHLAATVVVEENESPEEALKMAQKTVEDFYAKAIAEVGLSSASDYTGRQTNRNTLYELEKVIDYKEQDKIAKADEEKAKYSSIVFTIRECKTKQQAEIVLGKNLEFLQYMQATDSLIDLIYEKFKN